MTIYIPKKVLVAGLLGLLMVTFLIGPQPAQVKAENNGIQFIAIPYQDVVRFKVLGSKASGEATSSSIDPDKIRVQVFNLAGQKVYDSGEQTGWYLDWDKTSEGEDVANGVYLWVVSAWVNGEQVNSKVGKLGLFPGGVKGEMAPTLEKPKVEPEVKPEPESQDESQLKPEVGYNEDVMINGSNGLVFNEGSVTTMRLYSRHEGGVSDRQILEAKPDENDQASFQFYGGRTWADGAFFEVYGDDVNGREGAVKISAGSRSQPNTNNTKIYFQIQTNTPSIIDAMTIDKEGKVGIGTTNPDATLEVHGSQSDLLALYDPAVSTTDPKFRVTKTGDVRADGSYYCGAGAPGCYQSGNADVAERINTSEWVKQGNVVEIDPEHPGFFRKTRSPYSTKVAGIISTSPGVIMGNDFDSQADKWDDNRPMLALAGRVPVKATAENGPIQIGDLLVSSSIPGYAMRCSDRTACIGAVIGKALEPLENGKGTIMMQVTLR